MALIDDTVQFNPWFWQQVQESAELGGFIRIEPDAVLIMNPLTRSEGWLCIYAAGSMGKICDWLDALPHCEILYWSRQIRDPNSKLRSCGRVKFTERTRRLLHV